MRHLLLRFVVACCLPSCSAVWALGDAPEPPATVPGGLTEYHLKLNTPQELQELFAYSSQRLPLVSGHRGGARPGFPENCLETFADALKYGYCLFEIDPRLTKDGQIVLHHDETLDRTTTGTGKVINKTLEELKSLRLRDSKGNVTECVMPTLGEALEWCAAKQFSFSTRKTCRRAFDESRLKLIAPRATP